MGVGEGPQVSDWTSPKWIWLVELLLLKDNVVCLASWQCKQLKGSNFDMANWLLEIKDQSSLVEVWPKRSCHWYNGETVVATTTGREKGRSIEVS